MNTWLIRMMACNGLTLVLLCQPAFAQPDMSDRTVTSSFEILHYEPLPPMSFSAQEYDGAEESKEETWAWSFEAFGRAFDLYLHPNDRLTANLPEDQKNRVLNAYKLYRGEVEAIDGSWVRLTRVGEKLSGVIWDGQELYIIDPMSVIAPALTLPPVPSSSHLGIYRLSDTRNVGIAACGVGLSHLQASPLATYEALVDELQERVPANAQGATVNLDMAVVADVQFAQIQQNTFGTSTEAAVIARMNVVDGIFSSQVGVQISLVEILELSQNGSLTSTNALTLLNQFGQFTASSAFTHPGAAHLFTGRDLAGNTIGIAYVNALCDSRFGVGVDEIRSDGTAGALIVAHELAHNFGAPHDNEAGSACASTPGTFLMSPVLNGSNELSECSLTQMDPAVNNAPCITVIAATTADLEIRLPTNPISSPPNSDLRFEIDVVNNGPDTAQNVTATVSIPNGLVLQSVTADVGSCSSNGGGFVTCNLGNIVNGLQRTVSVTVQGQTVGQFFSDIAVDADTDDPNVINNSDQAVMNISSSNEPTIVDPSPDSTLSGATATFTWVPQGVLASEWWLQVGNTQGEWDLHDSGSLGTALSHTVSGLPTDGRVLWVRLWYVQSGTWQSVDFQYTAASQGGGDLPAMLSPAPGTTLSGATATFIWDPQGVSASEWWLQVGNTQGDWDLHDSGSLGTALSHTVSGLPTDGRVLWVRLWYVQSGSWQSVDFQYTAASQGGGDLPAMLSPAPGTTLSGATATFTWDPQGVSASEWWLQVGNTQGDWDLHDSGSLGTALSHTVSGLPTDGRVLWVRLWYVQSGSWQSVDFQYTAASQGGGGLPAMLSPAPGTTLSGATATFTWDPRSVSTSEWWLQVGNTQGDWDLHDSGSLGTALSHTVSGLPTDGRVLWVRLWYVQSGSWQSVDFQYTAAP